MDFSLFFFSADAETDAQAGYRFLFDAARFADEHDFAAIWVPERHFHRFGGLYPNPSVVAAALSTITERVRLRAGSVVLPLHRPLRVAEEWAVVDNLSDGRVDISFATGWLPRDFALNPDGYEDRRDATFGMIEEVQRLWSGETSQQIDGKGLETTVGVYPRPVQPCLQPWISTGFSRDTFERAGASGANILTALLSLSVEQLEDRLDAYRTAREANGHDPDTGHVTVMLHTFVAADEDEVRPIVEEPLREYLKSHAGLVKSFDRSSGMELDVATMSEEDEQALLDYAFERYLANSSLLGTVESCSPLVARLDELGVSEVACLLDFGVDSDVVLRSLPQLDRLRHTCNDSSVTAQAAR